MKRPAKNAPRPTTKQPRVKREPPHCEDTPLAETGTPQEPPLRLDQRRYAINAEDIKQGEPSPGTGPRAKIKDDTGGSTAASSATSDGLNYLRQCHLKRTNVLRLFNPRGPHQIQHLFAYLEEHHITTVYLESDPRDALASILQQLGQYGKLVVFKFHFGGILTPQELELVKQCLQRNQQFLRSLDFCCAAIPDAVKEILPYCSSELTDLNLSNNIIKDTEDTVEKLKELFLRSRLLHLKLHQWPTVVRYPLYACLEQLGPRLALETLSGLDLSVVADIPPPIRSLCLASTAALRDNHHILEFLKNKTLAQLLCGQWVRVWWPPTQDTRRKDFAGRYWPAQLLFLDPATLSCVVEYENAEVDQVPHFLIQPLSPFCYRDGSRHVPQRFVRSSKDTKTQNTSSNEAVGTPSVLCWLSPTEESNLVSSAHNLTSRVSRRSVSRGSPTSAAPFCRGVEETQRSVSFSEEDLQAPHEQAVCGFERAQLGIPASLEGLVLWPGEVCEFREPFVDEGQSDCFAFDGIVNQAGVQENKAAVDVNDFVAVVDSVYEEEPLYALRYIFHDDTRVTRVSSYDVRRAVHVSWRGWRLALFEKVLQSSRRAPSKSKNVSGSATLGSARRRLPSPVAPRSLSPTGLVQYIAPLQVPLTMESLSKRRPYRKPSELPLSSPDEFAQWFIQREHQLDVHPLVVNIQAVSRVGDHGPCSSVDVSPLPLKRRDSRTSMYRRLSFLIPYYDEALQLRKENERIRHEVIRAKRGICCAICLDRPLDTVTFPCKHLACCFVCAQKVEKCVICRGEIVERVVVANAFVEVKGLLDKASHEEDEDDGKDATPPRRVSTRYSLSASSKGS